MNRLALLIALLWAGTAAAQTQTLILDRSLQDNELLYGTTTVTRGQIVIAQNGTEPCFGVVGLGARSKLTPNAAANAAGWFIISQNANCIEPMVEHVYLFGNHGVPDYPHNGQPINVTAGAINIAGSSATVRNCQIFDFEGWAVKVQNSATETSAMRRLDRVEGCNISHCNDGIWCNSTDGSVTDNTIANVAGIGILLDGGAMQCANNHAYGTTNSIVMRNGASFSIGDKASDANTTGFHVESSSVGSTIIGLTSVHCADRNVWLEGGYGRLLGSYIEPANSADEDVGIDHDSNAGTPKRIVGIDVASQGWLISDCHIALGQYTLNYAPSNPRSSIGIFVWNNNTTIRDVRIEGSTTFTDEIGVYIAPDVENLDIKLTVGGGASDFNEVGDAVVWFADDATPTWKGTVDVIYDTWDAPDDAPVRIPAGWPATLKLRVRSSTDDEWTELTTGQAYNPN